MLKQRVITGIVYGLCVFAVLFLLPRPFVTVAFFLLTMGCFIEWMRLAQVNTMIHKTMYALLFFAGSLAMLLWPVTQEYFILMACMIWVAIIGWLLCCIRQHVIHPISSPLMTSLGLFTLWGMESGLLLIHAMSQHEWLLLMLFVIVWSSDSFAYFIGRQIGRHKIAPVLSPGKSLEGLIGAIILTVIVMLAYYQFVLHEPFSVTHVFIIGIAVIIALFGDLFESALKRLKGVKDSGTLLPGHGGLLDRFDSLIALTPFLALALSAGVA